MSNCTNKPASSLVAGTFIGKDCEGNEMGAGGTFASCNDLNNVKQGNTQELNNIRQIAQDAKTTASNAASDASDASDAASNAASDASDALQEAQNASGTAGDALQTAQTALGKAIVRVNADGDKRDIILEDGTEIPFYITDTPQPPVTYNDQKVIGFGVEGDSVVITMLDGTKHDLTRQQFADWLSAQDSSLATDEELAEAIANGSGNLQSQIDALQDQLDAINTDQASLSIDGTDLVLTNEDGTSDRIALIDLLPLSPDSGNLLEMRDNGIYYGIEAPPNLANIYVDGQNGDDSLSPEDGGGSKSNPFKTLQRALDVTPTNKSNNILLKSTLDDNETLQEYMHERYTIVKDGAVRYITSYGEPNFTSSVYQCARQSTSYPHLNVALDYKRPIIRQAWYKTTLAGREYQTKAYIRGTNGGKLSLGTVNVVSTSPTFNTTEYPIKDNLLYIADGKVSLYGTILTDNPEYPQMWFGANTGDTIQVDTLASYVANMRAPNSGKAIGISGATLGVTVNNGSFVSEASKDCFPDNVSGERLPSNMLEFLQQGGMISGIVRGNSGDPLNVTANFNV